MNRGKEMVEQETAEEVRTERPKGKSGNGTRRRALAVLLTLLAAGVVLGGWMWYRGQTRITTDNAFVEAHVFPVSARVPGHVAEVAVEDNQRVARGDLLVVLDPIDYRVQVQIAEAKLATARNETSGDHAQAEVARAAVRQAEAQLRQAGLDLKRGRALLADGTIPREQVERLETARTVAAGRLGEARESLRRAVAMIGAADGNGREARIAQRAAELEEAKLRLSYTRILAPADGYVTRRTVEEGTNVAAGQPLLAVVQLADPWVVANYKESQLTHVRPGQRATFTVDAYPGREFTGKVESIMAGTGSAFSLLPPENATGNYVKVVQRVPVKIVIDRESDPQHLLRVGMSVVPTVHTGRRFREVIRRIF